MTEIKFIPQMEPWFGIEEKNALSEYMDEGGFMTEYKRTQLFENLISEFTGVKHTVVVNNGTISLTLAAIAAGIGYGDEVIVPNYTMIATPNSVKMLGAIPVFVDVEPGSLCLDIELVRKAITKKTKAIFLVSANGRYPAVGIDEFKKLADEVGVPLIEDAAQALGSFYPDGKHIGSVGLIGSFSFSAPKIISTGQGGALITNDDQIAEKIRRLKDFGRSAGGTDIHDSIGYNFKFTDLQACIGVEQMKKLPYRIARKKEIFARYRSNLHNVSQIKLFDHNLELTSPWFIDSLVDSRASLISFLKEKNIGTRIMYPPINKQKAYNVAGSYPVCEAIGTKGLWLPSATQLSNEQIDHICKSICEFYEA